MSFCSVPECLDPSSGWCPGCEWPTAPTLHGSLQHMLALAPQRDFAVCCRSPGTDVSSLQHELALDRAPPPPPCIPAFCFGDTGVWMHRQSWQGIWNPNIPYNGRHGTKLTSLQGGFCHPASTCPCIGPPLARWCLPTPRAVNLEGSRTMSWIPSRDSKWKCCRLTLLKNKPAKWAFVFFSWFHLVLHCLCINFI